MDASFARALPTGSLPVSFEKQKISVDPAVVISNPEAGGAAVTR